MLSIQKLCNFDFYPKVKVPACVLDDRNLILLANLEVPFSLTYKDKSVPMRNMTTNSHYIAPKNNWL